MDDAFDPGLNRRALNGSHDDSGDDPNSSLDQRASRSLTHRPRALAALKPSAASAIARPSTRRPSGSPLPREANGLERGDRPRTDAPDLKPFADQLIAIAEQLRSGAFGAVASAFSVERCAPLPVGSPDNAAELVDLSEREKRQVFAELARSAYAKRRKRTSIFGDTELFGEPGWDILLDLYIAQAEDKPVSVSSACIGSASPPTTGLRWLGVLADQGLVEREHDPDDQRRVLVRLTPKALEAMDTYFASSAGLNSDRRGARR
ncbi:MAG: winged helix DNA-binding protein [Erythrobacter sp.]|uniref:winged helix DNA-binding protein n=1 Tax=Erythrobacter sp. TaxID=1042 RepID=UPI0026383C47|nr:winged helix DNA-binding protein [Erythrobacter sp.]MDJ0977541.1 winged helix DNA-binding protein [Erythrobacter sp.]